MPASPRPSDRAADLQPGLRRYRVFWATWVAITALSFLWSLATPIGASPDEPAHIIKAAAVAHGEFTGTPGEGTIEVDVPQYIAWTHAQTCYAFNDEVTADCSPAVPEPDDAIVESTTTAGLYNPVYYLIVGWPSLVFDSSVGVYAMRLMSALLGGLFFALTAMLIASWRRPALPLAGLAVIATPMVLFLNGSVNPNALEAIATVTVVVAMLSILLSDQPGLLAERTAVLAAAGVMALNARGLSPLWFAVAVIVPLVLAGWPSVRGLLRRHAVIIAIGVVGAGAVFAVIWTIASNSLGNAITDPEGVIYPMAGSPAINGFAWTLERTPDFLSHMIGLFGWMDTAAPAGVVLSWATAIIAVLVAGLVVLRGRALWTFVALLAAAVLLPPIIQGLYITSGGYIWQGRYNLPLVLAAIMMALALLSTSIRFAGSTARRLIWITVIVLGLAHVYVFAYVLRRYAVGLDDTWLEFARAPAWSAPGGNLLLVGVFAVITAGVGLLLARTVRRAENPLAPLDGYRSL